MKVAVVTVAPSPHLWGVLAALSSLVGMTVEIWCRRTVVTGREWEQEARDPPWRILSFPGAVRGDVWKSGEAPRALVLATSYLDPATGVLALQSGRKSIPAAVWWERPSRISGRLVRASRELPIRAILGRVDGLIGMTEDTVRHYTERYGYAGSTEWCPYHRDLRHLLNLSSRNPNVDSPPVFIITAVLTERKAVDVAIRGLARAEVPGTLLVVGGGPLQPSLEALAAKLLPGRVVFTGAVGYSEVPGLLSNGSAFLFPSRHDGFGMSVMEALAAGLPVLASNEVSAARQYIKNGINGWLLPADDVDAWAAAIRRMTTTGFLAPKLTERVRASLAGYDATADAARLARFLEAL